LSRIVSLLAGTGMVAAALLAAGCGGGGTPAGPSDGVPTPSLDDVLRAYTVTPAVASGLDDPETWTAAVTATRLVVSFTPTKPGYSTGRVREDVYNAHGSYTPFDQSVDLRAAYTSSHIYIYASWQDHSRIADAARDRWYVGAGVLLADHFDEPTVAAATQRVIPETTFARHLDEDALMLMFPIGDPDQVHDDPVTAPDGTQTANEAGALDRPFSQVGCQAACHAGPMRMAPAVGRVDVWNWRAGTSNALGYAHDESGGGGAAFGRATDGGQRVVALNGVEGPAVEYDPATGPQVFTHPVTGARLTVDPLDALLTGHTRPFDGTATRPPAEDDGEGEGGEEPPADGGDGTGTDPGDGTDTGDGTDQDPPPDIEPVGRDLYESDTLGYNCAACHGVEGIAGSGGAPPMASFARAGASSADYRARMRSLFASAGAAHYAQGRIELAEGQDTLTAREIADLSAYLAALPPSSPDPVDGMLGTGSGVAGVILTPPTGNAADIAVLNAYGPGGLSGVYDERTGTYTVVLRRALDTGHDDDDVTLTGSRGDRVLFGVAVSDGDRRNHAGRPLLTLEFAG
jgi:mono/diheme cytochrome c family protein